MKSTRQEPAFAILGMSHWTVITIYFQLFYIPHEDRQQHLLTAFVSYSYYHHNCLLELAVFNSLIRIKRHKNCFNLFWCNSGFIVLFLFFSRYFIEECTRERNDNNIMLCHHDHHHLMRMYYKLIDSKIKRKS